jgi:hypothetical protein
MDVQTLAERINSDKTIGGITLSGGEPLLHPQAITQLLQHLNPMLTIILYSGFRVSEVAGNDLLLGVIKLVDLAIMGRYDRNLEHPYLGKEFMLMSDRIDINYFKPRFFVEYSMGHGHVTKTGIFKTT